MNSHIRSTETINEDTFIERFGVRPNHLDGNASFDFGDGGCLYETYGPELAYVRAQNPNTVWTVVDGDEGQIVIVSGFHFVNRIGYLVTSYPFEDDVMYSVTFDRTPTASVDENVHGRARSPLPDRLRPTSPDPDGHVCP